jgi:arsenite-transporting ATPase
MTTRVLLISGKGGVGKTTVAAATGLAAAANGAKTLVLSFDMAHSLLDAFDVEEQLISGQLGKVVQISEYLDVQEINLQDELQEHWGDTYQLVTGLLYGGGRLGGVFADEVGVMPGMEDLIALTCLQRWVDQNAYELIVVDCPPTAETLGFVGFSAILQWYVHKRLPFDRSVTRAVRPIALTIDRELEMFLPEDHHFDVFLRHAQQTDELDAMLRDTARTSVRLVTNPEKMVVQETKRAMLYFSMYGMNIDAVIVNRVLPAQDSYFAARVARQAAYLEEIEADFSPIPILRAPWQPRETVGRAALSELGAELFRDRRPEAVLLESPPLSIEKVADDLYQLELSVPFVSRDEIDLHRNGQTLSVRVGQFKRSLVLPRTIAALSTREARLRDNKLVVVFGKAELAA